MEQRVAEHVEAESLEFPQFLNIAADFGEILNRKLMDAAGLLGVIGKRLRAKPTREIASVRQLDKHHEGRVERDFLFQWNTRFRQTGKSPQIAAHAKPQ